MKLQKTYNEVDRAFYESIMDELCRCLNLVGDNIDLVALIFDGIFIVCVAMMPPQMPSWRSLNNITRISGTE